MVKIYFDPFELLPTKPVDIFKAAKENAILETHVFRIPSFLVCIKKYASYQPSKVQEAILGLKVSYRGVQDYFLISLATQSHFSPFKICFFQSENS